MFGAIDLARAQVADQQLVAAEHIQLLICIQYLPTFACQN
jgi:hypothetical protein